MQHACWGPGPVDTDTLIRYYIRLLAYPAAKLSVRYPANEQLKELASRLDALQQRFGEVEDEALSELTEQFPSRYPDDADIEFLSLNVNSLESDWNHDPFLETLRLQGIPSRGDEMSPLPLSFEQLREAVWPSVVGL